MSKTSSQSAITQFWYMLEQLILFDLTNMVKKLKKADRNARILVTEEDRDLPWLNPDVLAERFDLSAHKNGKIQRYDYQVYLGAFPSKSVTDFIQSLPKRTSIGFEDVVSDRKSNSCYVSFKIDADGLLVDGSLTCSAAPWALKRIGEMLTSQKQLDLDTWTEDFHKHIAHLQTEFSDRAQANIAANRKTTIAELQGLLDLVCKDIWKPKESIHLGHYVIQRADRQNDETVSNIINSFYLNDLASASAAMKAGTASPALQQYLTPTISNRINVEQTSFLQQWLSPKHLPLGRWPSNPKYNLSLMQQLAVNLAIEKLKNRGGIFSVNGPPGTGKTTLLRDLIADLIVQRAEQMTKYLAPAAAFTKVDDFYRLAPSLTGFEIIVSSSNNAAVKNVTAELPALDAIDEQYQDRATYFRAVAESVKAAAQKQSEGQESDNATSTQSQIQQEIKVSADIITSSTWGLIAGTLGKQSNCNEFCEGFWWDKVSSIQVLLQQKIDSSQWNIARQDFDRCKHKVLATIEQREKWCEQINTQQVSLQDRAAKNSLGKAFGDNEWWSRSDEERQSSAPWVDEELNQARTDLFLAALNVHEQFIRQAATPFKTNLRRWVDLVKGDRKKLSDEQILDLWQTLFLVVPVISTTLASVQKMFDRLPPAAFGWLLIDEAGQGIPQAVVGALQRAKRAIVVGDPFQIEPVFTLDTALTTELQIYFGVEDCWSPTTASIQTISDRANPFGTEVKVEDESKWIGCPLWVHRRCIEPMATISNQIAYQGKMVIATMPPKPDKQFPLGDSRWIDIGGECQNDPHWITAQGDEVVKLLTQLVVAEKALPNLYIISPFNGISSKLKSLLKEKKSQWAIDLPTPDIDNWVKESVGTVHTFQGKEADAVIFVLGGDKSSQPAIKWASEKPNILNVAATRAKYRLYIIGNRKLWSLNHFQEAIDRLPHEVKIPDEVKPPAPRPVLKQDRPDTEAAQGIAYKLERDRVQQLEAEVSDLQSRLQVMASTNKQLEDRLKEQQALPSDRHQGAKQVKELRMARRALGKWLQSELFDRFIAEIEDITDRAGVLDRIEYIQQKRLNQAWQNLPVHSYILQLVTDFLKQENGAEKISKEKLEAVLHEYDAVILVDAILAVLAEIYDFQLF
jgi:hypothetical protein